MGLRHDRARVMITALAGSGRWRYPRKESGHGASLAARREQGSARYAARWPKVVCGQASAGTIGSTRSMNHSVVILVIIRRRIGAAAAEASARRLRPAGCHDRRLDLSPARWRLGRQPVGVPAASDAVDDDRRNVSGGVWLRRPSRPPNPEWPDPTRHRSSVATTRSRWRPGRRWPRGRHIIVQPAAVARGGRFHCWRPGQPDAGAPSLHERPDAPPVRRLPQGRLAAPATGVEVGAYVTFVNNPVGWGPADGCGVRVRGAGVGCRVSGVRGSAPLGHLPRTHTTRTRSPSGP
jgi:hypothetical protein